MSLKFKGISIISEEKDFSIKKINLNYTIGIIKPNIVLDIDKLENIFEIILNKGFRFKFIFQRNLTIQEVDNIYFKYRNEEYYKKIKNFNTIGDSIVFLLIHEDNNIDVIKKWKELIGNDDPSLSKSENPESLIAIYGHDIINNAFYGSDNKILAEKNRKNFKFPIPQKVPDFKYDKYKITLNNILKFLFPSNLEHFSVNTRLDLFAKYGPIYNQHSLELCFCKICHDLVEKYLEYFKLLKEREEKIKMGINQKKIEIILNFNQNKNDFIQNLNDLIKKLKENEINKNDSKYKLPPFRLLPENSIVSLWNLFCNKCIFHIENFTHLLSGRNNQHIVTDLEIDNMIKIINKQEVLEVLKSEMGNGANVMIEELDLTPPKILEYNKDHIIKLFSDLESDYYGRYDFEDLQKIILEDRRIRLNYWISIILKITIEKIKMNKHIDLKVKEKDLRDIKNKNFTLKRILPISLFLKKKNINEVPLTYKNFNFKRKEKYSKIEERYIFEKLLHRNGYKLFNSFSDFKGDYKNCVYIMKDIHEGKNSNWNNYCCLKQNKMESYIKYKSKYDVK